MIVGLKSRRQILLGLATSFAIAGSLLLLLSVGTDHWRVKHDAALGISVSQGLSKECFQNGTQVHCKAITATKTFWKMKGQFQKLVFTFIVAAIATMALSLLLTLTASCSQRYSLLVVVTSLETVSGILIVAGISVYTHFYAESPWKMSWSYILCWAGLLMIVCSFTLHLVAKDVKFFGKKMLTPTMYWRPVANTDPV